MKPFIQFALAILGVWFLYTISYSPSAIEKKENKKVELAKKEQAKEDAEEEAEKYKTGIKEKRETLLKDLIKKYNPLIPDDWKKKKDQSDISINYRLVNEEGRPALFFARMVDAYQSNDKYFLRLSTSEFDFRFSYESLIDFKLDCSKKIVNTVVKNSGKYHHEHKLLVIAKFNEFKKIDYLIDAENDGESTELIIRESPSFVAKGKCIQIEIWPSLEKGNEE